MQVMCELIRLAIQVLVSQLSVITDHCYCIGYALRLDLNEMLDTCTSGIICLGIISSTRSLLHLLSEAERLHVGP